MIQHPAVVRVCHWAFALSLLVLIGSGLEVFAAFPSFGEKLPVSDLFVPPSVVRLGGWLGGALQWHFTFAWLLAAAMMLYFTYQFVSGNVRQVLFASGDVRGVWPMARHYLLCGPKPAITETYNPLQKLAYSMRVAADRRQPRHGVRPLQAGATVLACLRAGRIPADAHLALRRDVRPARVHPRTPRHGRAPRLAKLRVDVDRRETGVLS